MFIAKRERERDLIDFQRAKYDSARNKDGDPLEKREPLISKENYPKDDNGELLFGVGILW